jgi:hypothetical protein
VVFRAAARAAHPAEPAALNRTGNDVTKPTTRKLRRTPSARQTDSHRTAATVATAGSGTASGDLLLNLGPRIAGRRCYPHGEVNPRARDQTSDPHVRPGRNLDPGKRPSAGHPRQTPLHGERAPIDIHWCPDSRIQPASLSLQAQPFVRDCGSCIRNRRSGLDKWACRLPVRRPRDVICGRR